MRTPLIAANWKMNKLHRDAVLFVDQFLLALRQDVPCDVVLCPPFTALAAVGKAVYGSSLVLGAQDVFWEKAGAFTGEISVDMLLDCGCRQVIIGHSERRGLLGESDEDVNRKVMAALNGSLIPIICVGETTNQRIAGATVQVVTGQLRSALADCQLSEKLLPVVAYEPVWAIGSGQSASAADAEVVARALRSELTQLAPKLADQLRILYGGSVKPDNIGEFMRQPNVDGALVGGASLKAQEFAQLIEAAVGRRTI